MWARGMAEIPRSAVAQSECARVSEGDRECQMAVIHHGGIPKCLPHRGRRDSSDTMASGVSKMRVAPYEEGIWNAHEQFWNFSPGRSRSMVAFPKMRRKVQGDAIPTAPWRLVPQECASPPMREAFGTPMSNFGTFLRFRCGLHESQSFYVLPHSRALSRTRSGQFADFGILCFSRSVHTRNVVLRVTKYPLK